MANLSTATTGAGASLASSFNPAGIAAIGAAIAGAATVGTVAIGALGGAIAELSGVLGLLPGLGVAGAAAVGTLTLATQGFSDALGDIRDSKKFNEDLKELSPNAAQAATAIQQLMPSIDGLRFATSDSLFAGVGQKLSQLSSTYLPAVQQMTTSIAGSFNQMFAGVANQLMTPETQGAIQSAMANIGKAFQNLVPAIGPVTQAIADLVNVSSGFLPGLATAISNAATSFSNFISEASKTGELKQWIQDGVDALKQLGTLLPDLKNMFNDFKANGKDGMDVVVGAARLLIKTLGGIADLFGDLSRGWKMQANVAAMSFGMIEKAISAALTPMREIIKLNNRLNPLFKIPEIPDFGPKQITIPFPDTQFGAPGTTAGRPVADPSAVPGPGLGASAGLPPVQQVFLPDQAKAGGSSKKQPLPTVAAAGQDPMSLLQGFPATASLYSAASSVLDNQQKVAQAQSDLNTLEKANVRDEDAIVAKRNELARAQREEHESELRLNEAKQQAVQKSLKGMQSAQGDLQQLGQQIDKDFGISKGLGGIVENLVKAVGNALAAPFLQALGFVAKANPNEGSGLVGIAAANGLFGQQYTPSAIAASQATSGGAYSSAGYASARGGGAYPGDAALLSMVPAGRYTQEQRGDLTQGLADCSSAVEDLVNIMDGRPTTGASMYTGNAAEWLTARGFMPGMGGPGDFRVGFNGGHMQATLPGGTPFNWGSDSAAARRGIGGTGADDPAFTQHFYRPAGGMVTGADQATTSLNSLASAANAATQALGGGGGGGSSIPSGGAVPVLTPSVAAPMAPSVSGLPFSWPAGGPAAAGVDIPGGGVIPGGGAPLYPGVGMPNALPGVAPLGQVGPAGSPFASAAQPSVGGGTAYPSHGGNSGNILGGMAMDGIMAATAGLDMLAPGTSAAAKIGIQVANRTIGYAAQNAGILANGIGEFFSIGDNPKGSIGAGWLGKLAGGIAGAGAALPNIAGQKAPQQQGNGQQQGGNTNNVNNTINVQAREGASGQEHGEQVAAETSRMYAPVGRQ